MNPLTLSKHDNPEMIRCRIRETVAAMTLEEKVSLLHGNGLFRTEAVKRLGVPALKMSDGPMGVRREYKNDAWEPLGLHDDFVTYFPSNVALAATWNPALARRFGQALGEETRGRGKDVILAPGINILRSPLCGRNFEYMSEDPHLIREMAVPVIQGIQERDAAACVKHFACNNQETERLNVDVQVDDRALHEIYFPGFRAAVEKGGSLTVMGAYNKLRGDQACESHYLLTEILRECWGFDGVVISDWGAVHDTVKAMNAGLDIEMNVTPDFDQYFYASPLTEKVRNGELPESLVDEKAERVLHLLVRLNMLGDQRNRGSYNLPEHRQAALETARESVVLLKNEAAALPLSTEIRSLAVIGRNADCPHASGGGSAEIHALYELTPLMGIRMILGGGTDVHYAPGYTQSTDGRAEALGEAVALAVACEKVVLFTGLTHDQDTEGLDRTDLKLPFGQDTLISAVLAVRPDAVIVNVSGSQVDMEGFAGNARAILQSWYAGMEGGLALAEVLFGKCTPSGKMPFSSYRRLEDCSAHSIGEFPGGTSVSYREGIFVGYRHLENAGIAPRFPFGHGLSYTTFAYSDLRADAQQVTVRVRNTGTCTGQETVQVYVRDVACSQPRPVKELKGFSKVCLAPGEERDVCIPLPDDAFSFYDSHCGQWVSEPGTFEILAGASSADIRLSAALERE